MVRLLNLKRRDPKNNLPRKRRLGEWYTHRIKEVEDHGQASKTVIEMIIGGKSIDFEVENGLPKNWIKTTEDIKEISEALDTEGLLIRIRNETRNTMIRELIDLDLKENIKRIRDFQNETINLEVDKVNSKEKVEIRGNLNTRLISNFTGKTLPEEIQRYLSNGRKFVPYFKGKKKRVEEMMVVETTRILNGIMASQTRTLFNPNTLARDVRTNLSNPNLKEEDLSILEDILDGIEEAKMEIQTQRFNGDDDEREWEATIKDLITNDRLLFLESDKGLGFSLLSMEQVITLYRSINKTQSLVLTDLDDKKYLEWVAELKKEYCPGIPKEIRKLLTEGQIDNFQKTEGEIAILRLLIKSGKVDFPSPETFKSLTARTIKTGVNDPVNGVSDIIRVVTQHLMKRMKTYIEEEFGTTFTVVGCDDAYKRIAEIQPQLGLSEGLNMQGDVTEMYPNCVFPVVRRAFNRIGEILKLNTDVMAFIIGGIYILMRANVVREPEGVFQMGLEDIVRMGLSIGDPCAAEVSDSTMMIYEIDMALALRRERLLQNLGLYLRFRDDIDTKIYGTMEQKLRIIWIIVTNFPHCFHLKISVSFFISFFLDIKRITKVGGMEKIALLRKKNNCYDVTRASSNTFENAKLSAMTCYAYRIFRRTNWQKDRKHQFETNVLIMKERGHNEKAFREIVKKVKGKELKRRRKKDTTQEEETTEDVQKRFIPAATWDHTTNNHSRICGILKRAGALERYKRPGYRTNKKVLQLVFTKKSFINYLEEFVGRPVTKFKKFGETNRAKDKKKKI